MGNYDVALLIIGWACVCVCGSEAGNECRGSGTATQRTELHIHLDGSVSVDTLLEIAKNRNLTIPGVGRPRNKADIWQALENVNSTWERFDVVNNIAGGHVGSLRIVAERFGDRQAAAGVTYTEVRYDPVRIATSDYARESIPVEAAVETITAGLRTAAERHGIAIYSLLCAMRGQNASACENVASLVAKVKSEELGGVVGMDLAGDEPHFNNSEYIECFRRAKLELGLNTTVHVGEAVRPLDVKTAVLDMLVDRIGHGYAMVEDKNVLEIFQNSSVHIEACPPGAKRKGVLDSIKVYKELGFSFGLNEDDPSSYFEGCTPESVEEIAKNDLHFTDHDISKCHEDSYAARFGPQNTYLC